MRIITNVRTVAMFVAVHLQRKFHTTSAVMLIVCLIKHFLRPSALVQSPQYTLYHTTTDRQTGRQTVKKAKRIFYCFVCGNRRSESQTKVWEIIQNFSPRYCAFSCQLRRIEAPISYKSCSQSADMHY